MKKIKKFLIFSFFTCLLALFSMFYLPLKHGFDAFRNLDMFTSNQNHPEVKETEPWMTVFVHGSFGSLLGFLSFSKVVKDDLDGSLYRDVNRKMRLDSFFYRDQPILGKGLIPISPSFNLKASANKKYAAFPIIKAYEMLLEKVSPHKEKNYFYTFGWTGLMSQQRRRLESLRFYNMLSEELEKLHKQGIHPKIRLIAHSHGGNLCLNLAAINNVLDTKNILESKALDQQEDDVKSDGNESINKMLSLITALPRKEDMSAELGQKRFGFVPLTKDLIVDELVLLGTPIQPETEVFFLSDTFKKIYHFYSEEDFVQQLDWVSTKQYFSNQRLNQIMSKEPQAAGKIIQAKIMYNRDLDTLEKSSANNSTTTKKESFFSKILSWGSFFSKKSKDPTHKDLWFISWKEEEASNPQLAPLPSVVFTPLLLAVLAKSPNLNDVDININTSSPRLDISLLKHNDTIVQSRVSIPFHVIEYIKEKFKSWKPDDLSDQTGFNALHRHLS